MLRCARLLAVALAAMIAVVFGPAAGAACHIAAFASAEIQAGEAAHRIALTVVLQGQQPSCEGAVEYRTVDGTALAGRDYVAASGTLVFREGDDRVEAIVITIIDNDVEDGDRVFTVELGPTTGGITGVEGPATVTILDDDGAPAETASAPPVEEPTRAAAPPAASPTGAPDADPSAIPLVVLVVALTVVLVVGALAIARRG